MFPKRDRLLYSELSLEAEDERVEMRRMCFPDANLLDTEISTLRFELSFRESGVVSTFEALPVRTGTAGR